MCVIRLKINLHENSQIGVVTQNFMELPFCVLVSYVCADDDEILINEVEVSMDLIS